MKSFVYFFLAISLFIVSCKDDNVSLPDNLVNFEAAELGFDADTDSKTITLRLSRGADTDIPVVVGLTTSGVTYGSEFSISPAVSADTFSLTIPKDSSSVSFVVTKADNVFLQGSEYIMFSIQSAGSPVLLGTTSQLSLKFSAIVSSGSTLTLNGGEGGSSAVNSVFVDFSNNEQSSVARASWDLGFYCGSGFRVILNNTTSACAVALAKNDLTQVTAADTAGLTISISTSNESLALIDDVTGDMSQTVIPEISATDAENLVYIVNRGTGGGTAKRDLKKIRILRTATGYTLQYANIADATFQSVSITKDTTYNFQYVSFDNSAVSVEPVKTKWDIEWTGAIYKTSYNGAEVPYYFADQVYINRLAGVTAAEVLTSTVSYDDFAESDIASLAFSSERNVIGANWRVTSGGTIGVKTDRFYVVKDAAGNVYKLQFLNFTSQDGGTRGYPNIRYGLVTKG